MVLFSGIQAAGKSTFFKERFVDTHLRINPCSTSGAPTGPSPSARPTMHSTDLEARMRQFEMALNNPVPPGFQIVARLDGRGFTRLTKEVCQFEAPFDSGFRDLMAAACRHLMTCGFNVLLAYSESDEISLLLHAQEMTFGRKPRKWISILAGEASAAFSLALGRAAAFDARLSVLPGREQVVDYFRWRMNDAARCCLNGHAYWLLRRQGLSARATAQRLLGMGRADKHELLFQYGVNFDALPTWQKRGFAVYWVERERVGRNPLTGEVTLTTRRELHTDEQLPWKDDYERALGRLLAGHSFLVKALARRGAGDQTSTETARDRAADRACTRAEGDDD